MDEKEDDAISKIPNTNADGGAMGEANISYEQQAKDHWRAILNDLGLYKAKDMIKYVNEHPDIGERIVDDVIAGMNKDKEITDGYRSA